jgi:hypothetical protein
VSEAGREQKAEPSSRRTPPPPADDPPPRPCDLCGGTALERHCKIVCLNCGYQRDCSDP